MDDLEMRWRTVTPQPELQQIAYAQNAEDVVLGRAFADQSRGFYVDVGAGHPVEGSVTKNLYDRGWSGLNIEPLPQMAETLGAERPRDRTAQVAIASVAGEMRFFELLDNWGMSTTVAEHAARHAKDGWRVQESVVAVERLDVVMASNEVRPGFDLLKIDVEGAEADVLASFELQEWRPRVVVVEATAPARTTVTHDLWEDGVLAAGYRLCLFDGLNRFYAREDEGELQAQLSIPANVFDQYIPYRWWRLLPPDVRQRYGHFAQ